MDKSNMSLKLHLYKTPKSLKNKVNLWWTPTSLKTLARIHIKACKKLHVRISKNLNLKTKKMIILIEVNNETQKTLIQKYKRPIICNQANCNKEFN